MSEFFKQLISQFSAVWQRLTLQQKIITTAILAFMVIGITSLALWSRGEPTDSGYKSLYTNLETEEAAQITEKLDEAGYKYTLENDGKTIRVARKDLYQIRMSLAREGLPKSRNFGYELFDKSNLGMSDFVQKINARRALEGELQRTIEGLEEVEATRIHIVIPEKTIFLDQQKDPKASVVIKTNPGRELNKNQVRGIAYLVSSSVDGLKPSNISIVDFDGRLLSNPYGNDETALASSRNIELQQNLEKYLENKAERMLTGVLGPGKATVQIAADLDFNQVERTMETYNPESRVIRSEERSDENTKHAPDGDRRNEHSLTNYEIDKTVEHLVRETGSVKRVTVSVAVDGSYEKIEGGERVYAPREAEELAKIEDMVKNAVGYDLARGDAISVTNVRFDNEYLRREQDAIRKQRDWELRMRIVKYIVVLLIAVLFIFFIRYFAKTVSEAMNPPVPRVLPAGPREEEPVEVSDQVRRSNELLDRVEMLTMEEPLSIAGIIRQWLNEPAQTGGGKPRR